MRDSPFLCLLYAVALALALTAPVNARHLSTNAVTSANLYQVYSGCAQPPNSNSGTTYYVKPAASGGSDAANGLTLGTAWATPNHAAATVTGGDTALVEAGTYGPISFSQALSSFATIKADAGQAVIITGYNEFSGGGKWIVQGLIFQDTFANAHFTSDPLVEVHNTDSNLVFFGNTFRSAPVATYQGWNAGQWANLVRGAGIDLEGGNAASPTVTCVSLMHNSFNGLAQGVIALLNSYLEVSNRYFWNDGDYLDIAGSNMEIDFPDMRNSLNPSGTNQSHPDFIQGQIGNCPLTVTATMAAASISGTTLTTGAVSGAIGTALVPGTQLNGTNVDPNTRVIAQLTGPAGGAGTYTVSVSQTRSSEAMTTTLSCNYSNITINGAVLIELDTAKTNVPLSSYDATGLLAPSQGISFFDLDWSNLKVINSQIANSSTYAIALGSCHSCTVQDDVGFNDDALGPAGIFLSQYTHQGGASDHVTFQNNIANYFGNDYFSATNLFTYNLITTKLVWDPNGSGVQFITAPGTYGLNVLTATAANAGVLVAYVPGTTAPSYNFHLFSTSPGLGAATLPAPDCIDNTPRGVTPNPNPPNAGAYC